jgi:FixJ family two-component response regulator
MMPQPTVVIVVDDNAGVLKSVARLLACHGIGSRTFASAEALLKSDSVQTATCLLLDIHLREFQDSSCSVGLRHRDRSAPSSS